MSDSKLQSFCNLFQTKIFYLIVFLKTFCHHYVVAFFRSRRRFGTGRIKWGTLKQKSSKTVFRHKLKSYTVEFTDLGFFFEKHDEQGQGRSEMTQNDMLLVATHTTRFSWIFDDLLSGSQIFLRRRKGLPNSRKIIIWEETRFFVIVTFF